MRGSLKYSALMANSTGRGLRMNGVEFITIIEKKKEVKMADAKTSTTISRRSTRLFLEEQEAMEADMERELRLVSEQKEQEKSQKPSQPQKRTPPTNSIETPIIPLVDFGKDLCGIFPSTLEDMNDHGMPYLRLRQSYINDFQLPKASRHPKQIKREEKAVL